MCSKYQVYTDFVSLLPLIVNLLFRFKFAAILFSAASGSLCKNQPSKMNVCFIFAGIAKLMCKCMVTRGVNLSKR